MDPSSLDWSDEAAVSRAIDRNPLVFEDAPAAIRSHRALVLQAVSREGMLLEHASGGLRNDPEIVLAAVSQNGSSLQFAGIDCHRNRSILDAAVQNDAQAIDWLPARLLEDADSLSQFFALNPDIVSHLSDQHAQLLGFESLATPNRRVEVLVPSRRLFPQEFEAWEAHEFVPGYLLLQIDMRRGELGIEATSGLWGPLDSDESLESLDSSAENDEFQEGPIEWWGFLGFSTIPSGAARACPRVLVYFLEHTFFQRDRELLHALDDDENRDALEDALACVSSEAGELAVTSEHFLGLLERTLGARLKD
jgi:hypothetical protein